MLQVLIRSIRSENNVGILGASVNFLTIPHVGATRAPLESWICLSKHYAFLCTDSTVSFSSSYNFLLVLWWDVWIIMCIDLENTLTGKHDISESWRQDE